MGCWLCGCRNKIHSDSEAHFPLHNRQLCCEIQVIWMEKFPQSQYFGLFEVWFKGIHFIYRCLFFQTLYFQEHMNWLKAMLNIFICFVVIAFKIGWRLLSNRFAECILCFFLQMSSAISRTVVRCTESGSQWDIPGQSEQRSGHSERSVKHHWDSSATAENNCRGPGESNNRWDATNNLIFWPEPSKNLTIF